jgi:hypothetical protein
MMARRGGNNVCISKDGSGPWETSVYAVVRRATTGIYGMSRGAMMMVLVPVSCKPSPRLCGVAASTYTLRTHRPFLHARCKASAAVSSPVQHHHSPPALRVPLKDVAWSSAAIHLQSSSQASQASRSLICRPTTSSPCSKAALLIPRQSCTGPGRQAAT